MHVFEAWAPRARTLAIRIASEDHPMQPADNGWWKVPVESAAPSVDYSFVVDGGDPVPDPRSLYQPHGVHGPSRLIDRDSFPWTDTSWQARPLSAAILYELHVGTFTPAGTFESAIDRLDYLRDLGITHIEMMPVNQFSGERGWGYDGVDLFAPHRAYGTPRDLKRFVDACHAKGLAVLLDVVYNHFGPDGNYLARFGPYFTSAYNTPWGPAVNLDHRDNREVRRFFLDNALGWLRDYHFDGLRLDAIHEYYDRSAITFLENLSSEVDALEASLGRRLVLIAESDLNDPRVVACREAGGLGIDAQWSDDFHHALHSVLTGETGGYYKDFGSLRHLSAALREGYVYAGSYSVSRARAHGRRDPRLSGHCLLGYSQNHDQIGNRAMGDRLCHLVSPGRQRIAAALVLTAPFVPMLFQGEEFGASSPFQYFTDHEDTRLAKSVSEGRRNEFAAFGWDRQQVPDPQDPATFARSKLRWEEIESPPHAALLAWYRTLIAFRRSQPSLTDGRLDRVEVAFDERARWLVMKRGPIEVACNFAPDRQALPVSQPARSVISSEPDWQARPGLIEIPADSVAILLTPDS
jgi:maltooligosyltrehalose trehalohydrolase